MTTSNLPKTARATTRGRITADECQKILRRVRKAPAIFTQDQMRSLDAKVREDADGSTRMATLAVLTIPGGEFLKKMAGDREFAVAIADVSECLVNYVGRLHQLTEVLQAAQARMSVALAYRKDMESVIQQARAKDPQEART